MTYPFNFKLVCFSMIQCLKSTVSVFVGSLILGELALSWGWTAF